MPRIIFKTARRSPQRRRPALPGKAGFSRDDRFFGPLDRKTLEFWAEKGYTITLYETRPVRMTAAQGAASPFGKERERTATQ